MGRTATIRTTMLLFAALLLATLSWQIKATATVSGEKAVQPRWAAPITQEGLPNLHKVADDYYRGAQPTADGIKELQQMGVKTILSFRAFHSDKSLLGDTGLDYIRIPMVAWHPEKEDIIQFLKIVTDPKRLPVFVHCQHGADRTGVMSAIYRIVVQGWTKDDAIQEMTEGGFGFHKIWKNLITFVKELDIEAIKKEAGLESAP